MTKLILSRKGFDSSAGGKPSVVYNNNFYSFPIPSAESDVYYKSLKFEDGFSIMDLFRQLRITMYSEAHLDPDIKEDIFIDKSRSENWRGIFGQSHSAQSHLSEMKVKTGDLFLFFGWYQHLSKKNNNFGYETYKSYKSGYHALWGYLEVGEVLNVKKDFKKIPDWAKYHPHCLIENKKQFTENNTIYIAAEKSELGLSKTFGTLKFKDDLILSAGENRSIWNLPNEFKGKKMSYHDKIDKIKGFQSVGRGQEFVLEDDSEIVNWATKLINSHIK